MQGGKGKKAREKKKSGFQGLFGGKKTRMYMDNPYPADMLKYNKRGKPVGVKMTTDSQGPNPRPTITEDSSSDKPSKPTSSSGGGGKDAGFKSRGKVTSVNAFTQKDKKEKKSAKEQLKESATKAADALKSKASEKKKEAATGKTLGQTRKQQRRATREDRVAKRRAGKTAIRNYKRGVGTDQAQMDANIEAEKQQIRDRRGRRNQFLRDFASQLARGEQARQPGKDYEGDYKEGDNFGQKGGSKENVAETAQTNENVEKNKEKLNTSSNDNSLMNTFLGTTNFAQKEFNVLPEFDASNINTNLTSSFNKGIATEDSTPQSAMRKLYNKKRGF